MKLLWSSRSPFVRKVMVAAHECGLADGIERVRTIVAPTKPNAEVMALNPLNKLPTLITGEGHALYDSRVICEHFDTLQPAVRLFPASGAERFKALRRQALGDGTLDVLLVWLSERNRAPDKQSAELIDACRLKLKTALDAMEREADDLAASSFGIGHISIGCALGYADFRFDSENWRERRPRLAAWHATIAARPSFKATEHADAY